MTVCSSRIMQRAAWAGVRGGSFPIAGDYPEHYREVFIRLTSTLASGARVNLLAADSPVSSRL